MERQSKVGARETSVPAEMGFDEEDLIAWADDLRRLTLSPASSPKS